MPSEALLISLSSCELGDTLPKILETTPLSAITNRFDSCGDSALKGVELDMKIVLNELFSAESVGEILCTNGCVATK